MSALHERLCETCMRILGEADARNQARVGELAGSLERQHCRELAAAWIRSLSERDAFAEFLLEQRAERFEIGYAKGCADRQRLQDSGIDLAEEVLRLRKVIESGNFKDVYAEGLMLGQKLARSTPPPSSLQIAITDVTENWRGVSPEVMAERVRKLGRELTKHFKAVKHTPPLEPRVVEKLWCAWCGKRHVDQGEFAERLHHTHRCVDDPWFGKGCGREWRLEQYVFGETPEYAP